MVTVPVDGESITDPDISNKRVPRPLRKAVDGWRVLRIQELGWLRVGVANEVVAVVPCRDHGIDDTIEDKRFSHEYHFDGRFKRRPVDGSMTTGGICA